MQNAKRNDENEKNPSMEKSPSANDMGLTKPTITYDKGYVNKFGGTTTQESMPGNGWRDSLSNLKGSSSPASANTIHLKANTVSHYSIEDVLHNEEEKLPSTSQDRNLENENQFSLNRV